MSVIASTYEQIRNSPLNNSPSKQTFVFSKSQRFPDERPDASKFSHNIARRLAPRHFPCHTATTFGVKRPDLFYSKERLSKPSPTNYNLPSTFKCISRSQSRAHSANGSRASSRSSRRSQMEEVSQQRPGTTTFGVGRECYKRVVSVNKFNYQPFSPSDPGPGHYKPKLTIKRQCSL